MTLQTLVSDMAFPDRLVFLRKQRTFTQQALADEVNLGVLQIRRYESGNSQPTLDVIRRLAMALSVTTDELVFDKDERQPDEDLLLQFEAVKRLDPDEKYLVLELIKGILLKHDAKRWTKVG